MSLPSVLVEQLKNLTSFNKEAFEKIHASGEQVTSIRINPAKWSMVNGESPIVNGEWSMGGGIHHSPFTNHRQIPWTQYGFYLDKRPSFTFDPLFHAGCYYVQEASSMFLEQALKQTVALTKPLKVLDLCAAPGGKSTHIHSLISSDSLLVSNEVIRSRAGILKDNIIKWGCENVVVTNNDPKDFAWLENYFDVIVVDAPCSGSGLFRRDENSLGEWSEDNVRLCSRRQQRILADIMPALKNGGILIYSTCSYSIEEDEDIVSWLTSEFPVEYSPLTIHPDWGIVDTGKGYRFWPDRVKGEGFFMACFQKKGDKAVTPVKINHKIPELTSQEMGSIEKWVKKEDSIFVKHMNAVYAWPEQHQNDFNFLMGQLRVLYTGTLLGELMRDKLVPAHTLAMSNIVKESIQRAELDYEQSIRYLQRKSPEIIIPEKGWLLVTYLGHPLGWINVLSNRINNYYPKELRIIKDVSGSPGS